MQVLTIGSNSGGLGTAATYPVRLEDALTRSLPDIEVTVESRGVSGEIAFGAAERLRNQVAEIEPDLVVWQVGGNDALARVDIEDFSQSLAETVAWIKSHGIDVVLVDPQYTASLAKDDYYRQFVQAIQKVAEREQVPLVQRYEAMRYLAGGRSARSRGRHRPVRRRLPPGRSRLSLHGRARHPGDHRLAAPAGRGRRAGDAAGAGELKGRGPKHHLLPRTHPEVLVDQRSTNLEGGLQKSHVYPEPSFEAAKAAPRIQMSRGGI